MIEESRAAEKKGPGEAYEEPELDVHGPVSELTKGSVGEFPDTAASGSYFPDGGAG